MTIEGPEDYDSLRQVGEAVAEAEHRLVFLFDEFEAVTKNLAVGPEFYAFLRSLANTLPICFICASGRNLKGLCATREISDSPFFNIFSSIHLGPFDARDAEALVCGPSEARGIPLSPILDTILSMGGNLPFFLQIACSAWFEYLEAGGLSATSFVRAAVPAEVMGTFREEAMPHFEFIVESLPAAELRASTHRRNRRFHGPRRPRRAILVSQGLHHHRPRSTTSVQRRVRPVPAIVLLKGLTLPPCAPAGRTPTRPIDNSIFRQRFHRSRVVASAEAVAGTGLP